MAARPVFDRPLRRDPILVVWALLNLVMGLVALNRHTTWSGSVEGWRVAAVLSDVATTGMTSYLLLALLPALLRWWWRRRRVSRAAGNRQRNWSGSRTLNDRDQFDPVVGPRLPDPWGSHRARGNGSSSVPPSDAGSRRRFEGAGTTPFRTSGPSRGADPAGHPNQGHGGAQHTSPLTATNGGAGPRRRTTAEAPSDLGERSPVSEEADESASRVLSDPKIEFVPWSQTTLRGPGRWRARRAAPEPTFRRVFLPQGPTIAGQPTRVGWDAPHATSVTINGCPGYPPQGSADVVLDDTGRCSLTAVAGPWVVQALTDPVPRIHLPTPQLHLPPGPGMTLSVAVDLSDGREGLVRTLRPITDTSLRFDFSPDEFDFGGTQHTTVAPGRPHAWTAGAAGARADEAPGPDAHRGESQ
jgi:hypothetical protein